MYKQATELFGLQLLQQTLGPAIDFLLRIVWVCHRAEKQQMVKDGKLKPKDIKNDSIIFKGEDNFSYQLFENGASLNDFDLLHFYKSNFTVLILKKPFH